MKSTKKEKSLIKKKKSCISAEVKFLLLLFVFALIMYGYLGYIKSTDPIDWSNPKKTTDFKLGIDKDKHEDFSVQYNVEKNCNVFGKGNIEFFYINTEINFNISSPTQLIDQIIFKHKVVIIDSVSKSFSLTIKINKNEYSFYLLDEQKYATNYSLVDANFYFGSKIKPISESSLTPATPKVPWSPIAPANTKEKNITPATPKVPWKPIIPSKPTHPLMPIVPSKPTHPLMPIGPSNTREQKILPGLVGNPFNQQEQKQISDNARKALVQIDPLKTWQEKNVYGDNSFKDIKFLTNGNDFNWKNKVVSYEGCFFCALSSAKDFKLKLIVDYSYYDDDNNLMSNWTNFYLKISKNIKDYSVLYFQNLLSGYSDTECTFRLSQN